jgi:hypothetical protein
MMLFVCIDVLCVFCLLMTMDTDSLSLSLSLSLSSVLGFKGDLGPLSN